jgi:hypothetical protein
MVVVLDDVIVAQFHEQGNLADGRGGDPFISM